MPFLNIFDEGCHKVLNVKKYSQLRLTPDKILAFENDSRETLRADSASSQQLSRD